MGGNCCSNTEKEPDIFPIEGPTPPLQSKTLYMSTIEDILNISSNRLDGTFIPPSGRNSLIVPLGGDLDPKRYVRFFLIFKFYIHKYSSDKPPASKQLKNEYEANFYKLVQRTHTGQEEQKKLQDFRSEFGKQTSQLKKWMVVVKHLFHDKFIIENLNNILLKSEDPKDIAHVAFPIAAIYQGIYRAYLTTRSKKREPVYIVAVLDSEEMDMVGSMKGRNCCFAFPTFMRGFTVEQKARKQLKKVKEQYKNQKTAVLFTVNFPNPERLDPLNDFGFYTNPDASTKEEGDVVFNVLNTFKIVTAFTKNEYDLEYGHLSALYYGNKTERLRGHDAGAIRIYDICEAVSKHYLKSQSCLFRIINKPEDSLRFSRSVISNSVAPTQSNAPPATEIEIENLINNYIDSKLYKQALQLIPSSNQSNLMKAKKLEILYKQGKLKEAEAMITMINPEYNTISQATEIRDFIEAKLTIKQSDVNSKNEALAKLRRLTLRMQAKYDSSFQVVGTEVIRAIDQLVGGGGKDKQEQTLIESQAETKAALQTTAINLRGVSTTI